MKEAVTSPGNLPESVSEDIKKLMSECWDGKPQKRPTFENVAKRLETIAAEPGRNYRLVKDAAGDVAPRRSIQTRSLMGRRDRGCSVRVPGIYGSVNENA